MLPYIDFFNGIISVFTLVLTFGIVLCIGVYIIRRIYDKKNYKAYLKMLFLVLLSSLLGGNFLSAISLFLQGKGSIIECIINSGNVFYGCLIGGTLALFLCAKHYKIYWLNLFDVCASILPLGQAVGRIGCFFNGCCYGVHYNGFMSVLYPIEGKMIPVFPTWFCESAFCIILFIILQILAGKVCSGIITSIYLISYSAFRFILEFLRGDEIRGTLLWLSTSQFIGCFIFVSAIVLFAYCKKKKIKNTLFLEVVV